MTIQSISAMIARSTLSCYDVSEHLMLTVSPQYAITFINTALGLDCEPDTPINVFWDRVIELATDQGVTLEDLRPLAEKVANAIMASESIAN